MRYSACRRMAMLFFASTGFGGNMNSVELDADGDGESTWLESG
jgi:hypothetical protein